MPIDIGSFASEKAAVAVADAKSTVEGAVANADAILVRAIAEVTSLKSAVAGSGLAAAKKTELNNVVRPAIKAEFQALITKIQGLVDGI